MIKYLMDKDKLFRVPFFKFQIESEITLSVKGKIIIKKPPDWKGLPSKPCQAVVCKVRVSK
jgi:hypothetical protein